MLPPWFPPILVSALALGLYDVSKKQAVHANAVMPVLFFATLSGTLAYLLLTLGTGQLAASARCDATTWHLIFLKTLLVSGSWICTWYAIRALPVSIASPLRASAPLWTFLGSLFLYQEFPSLQQGAGMLLIFAGYLAFSLLGRREGIPVRSHGMLLCFAGTLLGAASALYDKYLLNVAGIPPRTLQFWFSLDLLAVLGAACLLRRCFAAGRHPFQWRWSIPATGVLLIAADYTYFHAVSLPDIHISVLSLVRRCNCVITFIAGYVLFNEVNIRRKGMALLAILAGVVLLALSR